MKKNILILAINSVGSINDGGIYSDMVKELKDKGHELTVVSHDETAKKDFITTEEGFINIRIASGKIQKTSVIKKVLNLRKLDKKSLKRLKKIAIKFDLVVCMISHCAFYKTVKFIKKRDDVFVYNMVKDIFPQNAVDLGMMKKGGLIYRYFKHKESKYYKISDCLGVLSDNAVEFLYKDNPALKNKIIEVNPNSCIPAEKTITEKEKKEILQKYDIPTDKTIFLYGGNLGKPQGIDFVLECIKQNESLQDSFFIIVGNGTEFIKIEKFFSDNKIQNSKLLHRLSGKEFENLCMAADVGLVFLSPLFTVPNYPSRTLSYMQVCLPIIFAVDKSCDAGMIAEKNNYGYNCISGDTEKFFGFVADLTKNTEKRKKMGMRAYKFMTENYSVKNSYEIIMKHLGEK